MDEWKQLMNISFFGASVCNYFGIPDLSKREGLGVGKGISK